MYRQHHLLIYSSLLLMSVLLSFHTGFGQVRDTSSHSHKDRTTELKKAGDSIFHKTRRSISSIKQTADTLSRNIKKQRKAFRSVPDTLWSQGKKQVKSLSKKTDSLPEKLLATTKKMAVSFFASQKKQIPDFKNADSMAKARVMQTFIHPFRFEKPLLAFNGGSLQYNSNYRSLIDTPFSENNVFQHTATINAGFSLGNKIPFQVFGLFRNSNSAYFRNIYDVQVLYDASAYQQVVQKGIKARMLQRITGLQDTLLQRLYALKSTQFKLDKNWFDNAFSEQRIIESNEALQLSPAQTGDVVQDSITNQEIDSLKKQATWFLNEYTKKKAWIDSLSAQLDSIRNKAEGLLSKYHQYRKLVESGGADEEALRKLSAQLPTDDRSLVDSAKNLPWLAGIRRFSLGRSSPSYSELTTRNVNLRGIDVEYSRSWYYASLTAGLIDYRFRDFVVRKDNRVKQYLVMGRLGIGRMSSNHVIVSIYKGKKQLFSSVTSAGQTYRSVPVTGVSLESKWNITRNIYVVGELAQSQLPDYRIAPAGKAKAFSLRNKTAQAYSAKIYGYIPATKTRLEAMYKSFGADFQSFANLQTNSASRQWYIKGEQYLFKRKLRITASVRSNEFTNPYIIQQFKTNSVFTSINATLRARRWPVLSIGYIPVSQLVAFNGQLTEYRFQTLTGNLSHHYKIGTARSASQLMYFRMFNKVSDTGYALLNATNFYWTQQFAFRKFSSGFNISFQRNNQFTLQVLEGVWQLPVKRVSSFNGGFRIVNFNSRETRLGSFLQVNTPVSKWGHLQLGIDNGWLPAFNNTLTKKNTWNIGYTKTL
jgi:hypothetical protein